MTKYFPYTEKKKKPLGDLLIEVVLRFIVGCIVGTILGAVLFLLLYHLSGEKYDSLSLKTVGEGYLIFLTGVGLLCTIFGERFLIKVIKFTGKFGG